MRPYALFPHLDVHTILAALREFTTRRCLPSFAHRPRGSIRRGGGGGHARGGGWGGGIEAIEEAVVSSSAAAGGVLGGLRVEEEEVNPTSYVCVWVCGWVGGWCLYVYMYTCMMRSV
jgi:hypothetical protein